MMKKLLALTIAGALILCVAYGAFGDLQPPYFYDVNVTLTDGTSITGVSYGLLGFFGSGLPYDPVKSVVLTHTKNSIKGEVTFFDNPKTETYEKFEDFMPEFKLSVYTEYETVGQQADGSEFYWVKKHVFVPIKNIQRVDTLNIIGKGFAIYQDPAVYANIKEPYLMVEDCGLGCPAKLFSEDTTVKKEELQALWDTYLDCKYRLSAESYLRMEEVIEKYQLRIVVDPFCID
jgi:hypothetical protein